MSALDFAQSEEASFRRNLRKWVRDSNITRCEREVLLALLNFWLHHRNDNPDGTVWPGRRRLAKNARVSDATVKRALTLFRENKIINAVNYLKGDLKSRKATEYTLNPRILIRFCSENTGSKKAKMTPQYMGGQKTTSSWVKMTPHSKMNNCKETEDRDQESDNANVVYLFSGDVA